MKWIFPVKIVTCACATLFLIQTVICAPQGLSAYKNYEIDRYSYENHPAVRRAKYLYGAVAQSRLPQDQTTLSTHNNKYHNNFNGNAITDPYAKRQFSDYKGYDVNDLQKYANEDKATTPTPAINHINQADKENAKFEGANNQEADDIESGRGLAHFKLKRLKRLLRNRCLPFGRDADEAEARSDGNAQDQYGRFLWDVNVYNLYAAPPHIPPPIPGGHNSGCAGLLGGLLGGGGGPGFGGGGIFSDPVAPVYPVSPLNNFFNMFAPGILQNALAATAPPPGADQQFQSDPNVNPQYVQPVDQQAFAQQQAQQQQQQQQQQPQPFPPLRPNRIYYDSPGAPPITPAQLVGGVATTVNGIIQQLTGNVQPVYQQPYG